jgi:hypothetical protein
MKSLAVAALLGLVGTAHSQVLSINVANANQVGGFITSICFDEDHCPVLNSEYLGQSVAEIRQPVDGGWSTYIIIYPNGELFLGQSFNGQLVHYQEGHGNAKQNSPLTPLNCAGTVGLSINGQILDVETVEWVPYGDGFVVHFRRFCDIDTDGDVDINDLVNFVNKWLAQFPQADSNADGVIDIPDLFEFLSRWLNRE